jgi:hypothetical protein
MRNFCAALINGGIRSLGFLIPLSVVWGLPVAAVVLLGGSRRDTHGPVLPTGQHPNPSSIAAHHQRRFSQGHGAARARAAVDDAIA